MSKQRNYFSLLQLVFFIFFVLCVGYFLFIFIEFQNQKIGGIAPKLVSQTQANIYHFVALELEIEVPENFEIDQKATGINLNSSKGTIQIHLQSSSFVADLDGHLRRLAELNGLKYSNRENFTIDGFNATKTDVYSNETDQYLDTLYFIFVDQSVYTFSASSPELFDELDQVARSFRYTGEVD